MTKKSRNLIIAGNWKMNHTLAETRAFFDACVSGWEKTLSAATKRTITEGRVQPMIFPSFFGVQTAQGYTNQIPVTVGAQNVHWEKSGAFTGEVSGPMLQELGIAWALVGHSERRQFFAETDETVKKRTESLLSQGLNVMMCIGESREEREKGQMMDVLKRQITGAITSEGAARYFTPAPGKPKLVIAYEPIWAIGTGLTASPAQAEEAHQFIRKLIWNVYGMESASHAQLLYGGSVKPDNIAELLSCPNIDGGLIGGASLKADAFLEMLQKASDAFG